MDGTKAIQYYNAKTRLIKVSRNIVFNENEEPKEFEIIEVLGVRVEGENRENPPQQPIVPPNPVVKSSQPEPRALCHTQFIDYTKLNNPSAIKKSVRRTATSAESREPPKQSDQKNLAEELFLGMTFLTTGTEEDLPDHMKK
jgi:hypothetical protein